jgi:nicotinamide-nucleotide amidase
MTDSLEAKIVRLLTERNQTLSLAESCTGGYLAHRVTNVPGASAIFTIGFVTYSNEAKQKFLGVRAETLREHGAVSEPVAREMAEGARRVSSTDFAIAVTGIAGPGGGSAEKPVGTVFIAVASAKETRVFRQSNPGERLRFKEITSEQALDQLYALIQSTS